MTPIVKSYTSNDYNDVETAKHKNRNKFMNRVRKVYRNYNLNCQDIDLFLESVNEFYKLWVEMKEDESLVLSYEGFMLLTLDNFDEIMSFVGKEYKKFKRVAKKDYGEDILDISSMKNFELLLKNLKILTSKIRGMFDKYDVVPLLINVPELKDKIYLKAKNDIDNLVTLYAHRNVEELLNYDYVYGPELDEICEMLEIDLHELEEDEKAKISSRTMTRNDFNNMMNRVMIEHRPHLIKFEPLSYVLDVEEVGEVVWNIKLNDYDVKGAVFNRKKNVDIFMMLQFIVEPCDNYTFGVAYFLRSRFHNMRLLMFGEIKEGLDKYYEEFNVDNDIIDIGQFHGFLLKLYDKKITERLDTLNKLSSMLKLRFNILASLIVISMVGGDDLTAWVENLEYGKIKRMLEKYQSVVIDNIDVLPSSADEVFKLIDKGIKRQINHMELGDDEVIGDVLSYDDETFEIDDETRIYLESVKVSPYTVMYVLWWGLRKKNNSWACQNDYIPKEHAVGNTIRKMRSVTHDFKVNDKDVKDTIEFLINKGILLQHKNNATVGINLNGSNVDPNLRYLQEYLKRMMFKVSML